MGLDLVLCQKFSVNSVKAMRETFIFLEEGRIKEYVALKFYAYWTKVLDISLEENLIKIVKRLNVNPNLFLNFIKKIGDLRLT